MTDSIVERRKSKRCVVNDFVGVLFGNRMGRLVNISDNGFAIEIINGGSKSLPESTYTSLLNRAKGFLVQDLPFKSVHKVIKPFTGTNDVEFNIIGVQFKFSNPIQKEKLTKFISELAES